MKRLLWVIGIFCAIVLVAVMVLPRLINLDSLEAKWLPVVQTALGRDVSVGRTHLSLIPSIGVTIEEIVVMDHPDVSHEPFLTAESVTARVALWPLFHRQVEVIRLTIDEPRLTLIRDSSGRWNYETMGPVSTSTSTSPVASSALSSPGPAVPLPLVSAVDLHDGAVSIIDHTAKGGLPIRGVDHLTIAIRNLAPGHRATGTLSARVDPSGVQIRLSGYADIDETGLGISGIDLQIVAGKSDLHIMVQPGKGATTGERTARGWDVRVESQQLDLNELLLPLMPSTAPVGAAPQKPDRSKSTTPATTAAVPSPWRSVLSGQLSVATITYGGLTAHDLHVVGTMEGEKIRIDKISGRVFEGSFNGKGTIKIGGTRFPFAAELAADGIDIGSVDRYLSGGEARLTGSGALSASMNGTWQPDQPWQAMMSRLTGDVKVTVKNGALQGIDLPGTVLKLLKRSQRAKAERAAQQFTRFSSLYGVTRISNGQASISSLQIVAEDFSLHASGIVGLTPPMVLDLRSEMMLSESLSRQVPSKSIAGLLLTDRGQVAVPVLIQGTVATPIVLPDSTALAERTGERLTERILNEVMTKEVEQLQEVGESLLKGLLGR